MLIVCQNALYSIISLVFLIVLSCCILFILNIEFLAFILLLIYIGAITVLFLFVVMMLELDKIEKKSKINFSKFYVIYFIVYFKLFFFILFFSKKLCLSLSFFSYEFIGYNNDLNIFSQFLINERNDTIVFLSLFSQKFVFFLVIGFSLLFSMVGSIALCLIKNFKNNI